MQVAEVGEDRIAALLADAAEFFEAYLWGAQSSEPGRLALAEAGLDEEVVRSFGVGYAPVGPDELIRRLEGIGYSTEELVAAGLANRSPRGRAHAHFRSRLMFPIKDREGRVEGFAGLGTHLGPSWALWVTSPETGLYRRSHAIFGLDLAARRIAASGSVLVRPDCIEVLRAHQEGRTNAVTVHSNELTRDQHAELAGAVRGGTDELELDLPEGIQVESESVPADLNLVRDATTRRRQDESGARDARHSHLNLKRVGIVIATALATVNVWIGAPLLAVWVGAQVQGGRLLSMRGVITVVAVLAVLAFLLAWALTWLSAKYDELTGRPAAAAQTSPWHRAKRGDRVQDIRSRYGVSPPEKVVAAAAVAGVLAFEIWFFFLAGSSLPNI